MITSQKVKMYALRRKPISPPQPLKKHWIKSKQISQNSMQTKNPKIKKKMMLMNFLIFPV